MFRPEHQLQVKARNLKAPVCCALMFEYQKRQQIYVAEHSDTSYTQKEAHLFLNIFTCFYMYFNTSIKQQNSALCLYSIVLKAEAPHAFPPTMSFHLEINMHVVLEMYTQKGRVALATAPRFPSWAVRYNMTGVL